MFDWTAWEDSTSSALFWPAFGGRIYDMAATRKWNIIPDEVMNCSNLWELQDASKGILFIQHNGSGETLSYFRT